MKKNNHKGSNLKKTLECWQNLQTFESANFERSYYHLWTSVLTPLWC